MVAAEKSVTRQVDLSGELRRGAWDSIGSKGVGGIKFSLGRGGVGMPGGENSIEGEVTTNFFSSNLGKGAEGARIGEGLTNEIIHVSEEIDEGIGVILGVTGEVQIGIVVVGGGGGRRLEREAGDGGVGVDDTNSSG